jgi:hypothetical protein
MEGEEKQMRVPVEQKIKTSGDFWNWVSVIRTVTFQG